MAKKWREYVRREFLETDNDFVDHLPYKSINSSIFGLITEASQFVPVRLEGKIHLKPLTEGLDELAKALENTPDPSSNFDLKEARGCLSKFGDQLEEEIKGRGKWEKMVEIAESNDEIISEEKFRSSQKEAKSFLGRLFSFFR